VDSSKFIIHFEDKASTWVHDVGNRLRTHRGFVGETLETRRSQYIIITGIAVGAYLRWYCVPKCITLPRLFTPRLFEEIIIHGVTWTPVLSE